MSYDKRLYARRTDTSWLWLLILLLSVALLASVMDTGSISGWGWLGIAVSGAIVITFLWCVLRWVAKQYRLRNPWSIYSRLLETNGVQRDEIQTAKLEVPVGSCTLQLQIYCNIPASFRDGIVGLRYKETRLQFLAGAVRGVKSRAKRRTLRDIYNFPRHVVSVPPRRRSEDTPTTRITSIDDNTAERLLEHNQFTPVRESDTNWRILYNPAFLVAANNYLFLDLKMESGGPWVGQLVFAHDSEGTRRCVFKKLRVSPKPPSKTNMGSCWAG